jgi:hypothetical protein
MEMNRFELIMALVDAWAKDNAGWDCRDEAEGEVRWCLGIDLPSWASVSEMTNQEIAESAIAAWENAE